MEKEIIERRTLDKQPFDHVFYIGKRQELCHSTGDEVRFSTYPDEWWNEYIDSDGNLHYGR